MRDDRDVMAEGDAVAARCEFQLTYRRAPKKRRITPGYIGGDWIDNADLDGPEKSTGTWSVMEDFVPSSAEGWLTHYAYMAIGEALHEGMEWFQVDGKPWVDPHAPGNDLVIDEAVRELVARLAGLRAKDRTEAGGA